MEADRPASQEEQRFPCPCEGENSDCIHCDGAGWTSHPVGLRARRTLSLSKPTPGRFRGKRELLFEQQFKREIPNLAAKTLAARKQGIRSTAFAEYINRLIEALDTGNSVSFWRGFVREVAYDDELAALQTRLQRLNLAASEPLQIVALAVGACIRAGACRPVTAGSSAPENAASQKSRRASQQVEREQPFACPHCGSQIYNQRQHNRLFHPKAKDREAVMSTRPLKKQALEPSQRAEARSQPPITQAKPPKRRVGTASGRSVPEHESGEGLERARADTGPVERAMDARATWGGRFRDTNGTFGSYPLHDNMDDESDPG